MPATKRCGTLPGCHCAQDTRSRYCRCNAAALHALRWSSASLSVCHVRTRSLPHSLRVSAHTHVHASILHLFVRAALILTSTQHTVCGPLAMVACNLCACSHMHTSAATSSDTVCTRKLKPIQSHPRAWARHEAAAAHACSRLIPAVASKTIAGMQIACEELERKTVQNLLPLPLLQILALWHSFLLVT